MPNRIELKKSARATTRSARVSAYVFTLIYLVLTAVLNGVNSYMLPSDQLVIFTGDRFIRVSEYLPFSHPPFPAFAVLFVSVLVWLLSSVLAAGWVLYHQGVRRGQTMPYSSLFDGFGFTGKIILLHLVMGLFVFLWTLLLVIPGIIAIYRYRFALYNLCENPGIGVMEALNMSKAQTRGHKWELFVLDLSFIGWSILCSLTLGILSIWIMPYMQQTDIGYFEAIKRMSGIGSHKPEDDGQFHSDDRFDGGPASYDPER